ncbi:hypothetical protein NLO98_08380 [Pseudomonas syringae]|nr:hypothetical protein [Pseudomonas syringae]
MVQGECKLCGAKGELRLSHFIPKFVGKWVKDTSATGYIRHNTSINKRSQDIAKDYWLCGACEGLFSDWEREFANKIFYPFVNDGRDTANYTDWLAKFCASLSWRTLSYIRSLNEVDKHEWSSKEQKALDTLSDFVLGKVANLGIYEQHLFPLDAMESTNADVPKNINRYLLRTMQMDILSSDNGHLLIYTKIPKFIVLGIAGHPESKKMRSSRVAINGGRIAPATYYWPEGFAQYLFGKANEISDLYKSMDPAQHAAIDRAIKKAPDRAANSGTMDAFRHDLAMFGRDVFSKKDADPS